MASRPDGDVWNIVDNDKDSQHYGRNFKLDFSYISSEEIKDVVKDYVWQNYSVGNKAISTLYIHLNFYLVRFFTFVENENKELSELTNADIDKYVSLLHTTISKRTGKLLGYQSQKKEFRRTLASHQFRATFVRELIKRKVPIAMIMKQYSHVSIEMTAHYLTLQEEEVKEIYSDMILSPESKIAGLRAKEIKGKLDDLFHGKTEDEIDDVISGLAKTMSFNPLPTGVCLYDFRRGNCTDGDGCFFYNCPNYITEVQFYPILKDELDLLEKEMARLKELGHEREWQKQYIKYKYLKPLVESLEVQLNGKESVG